MKDIDNFRRKYAITANGEVWSYPKQRGRFIQRGKYLKQIIKKHGYLTVCLAKNKKHFYPTVHRLIATAFISNPTHLPQVNHKNGIKTDNRIENLEWCSPQSNIKHAFLNGLIISPRGEKHYKTHLKEKDIKTIRSLYETSAKTHKEISLAYKISRRGIGNIIQRRTWKHV